MKYLILHFLNSLPLILAVSTANAMTGQQIYARHCANCHDTLADKLRAPSFEVLKLMEVSGIYKILRSGTMKKQALRLSFSEMIKVSEYITGKRLSDRPRKNLFVCADHMKSFGDWTARPHWNGWGAELTNTRYQSTEMGGLRVENIPRLKLSWAFGYYGATSALSQPAIADGKVFVGSESGDVVALDAKSGCLYWTYTASATVRTAIVLGERLQNKAVKTTVFFADVMGSAYGVDALTGQLIWKTKLDEHPYAKITGSPLVVGQMIYFPVSSREETVTEDSQYICCTFRGSVVALDLTTGRKIWKTYMIKEASHLQKANSKGVRLKGPSGVAIFTAPTYDAHTDLVYVATGNNYSDPSTENSDAIVAIKAKTGQIVWSHQVFGNDIFNSCRDNSNCPEKLGPDYDFASSPILTELKSGKRILLAGNKSGIFYALDPDAGGKELWSTKVGRGGSLGGIQWGSATDDSNAYVPVADLGRLHPEGEPKWGIYALNLEDGKHVWAHVAANLKCDPYQKKSSNACLPEAYSAAVTAVHGAVFSGTVDGKLMAFSTKDGGLLWEYNALHEFQTVNSVPARGGAFDGSGPVIVDGTVFVNSGYQRMKDGVGNVLLAFRVEN